MSIAIALPTLRALVAYKGGTFYLYLEYLKEYLSGLVCVFATHSGIKQVKLHNISMLTIEKSR